MNLESLAALAASLSCPEVLNRRHSCIIKQRMNLKPLTSMIFKISAIGELSSKRLCRALTAFAGSQTLCNLETRQTLQALSKRLSGELVDALNFKSAIYRMYQASPTLTR